ncbi:MAG UNVERIFIED_CONTAM: hypothetical protein LVR18_10745 [Planctomycetaceae bacterium]|jgi:hypothetical protein
MSLKRRVALKVVNQLLADSARQLQRFRREAESAARLHHSNIVPVFGFGEDRGVYFYAMQLIEGATLAEIVATIRELPMETAASRSSAGSARSADSFSVAASQSLRLQPPPRPPGSCWVVTSLPRLQLRPGPQTRPSSAIFQSSPQNPRSLR